MAPVLSPVRQCDGKRTYLTKSEAKRMAKRTMSSPAAANTRPLTAYRCQWCRRFHIGHTYIEGRNDAR